MSIAEAAERLGVHRLTVNHMIANGTLRASKLVGRSGSRGRVVIRVSDVEKMLDETAVS
jgi:excisionase family DNA binding protein